MSYDGRIIADARHLPIADESVQCCITSPPYWGLRDYGTAKWTGGDENCSHATVRRNHHGEKQETSGGTSRDPIRGGDCSACGATRIDSQLGLESTPEQYVANMVQAMREVWRVLRPDGTLWLNLGDCYATGAGRVGECPGGGDQGARWAGDVDRIRDEKRGYRGDRLENGRGDQPAILRQKTRATRNGTHAGKHIAMAAIGPMTQPNRMPIAGLKPKDMVGIPWRVAFALQAEGWYLRSDIIWAKPNPMPESVTDRPTRSHEYLFLLTKSERYFYDAAAIMEPCVSADEAKYDNGENLLSSDVSHAGNGSSTRKFRGSGNKQRQYRNENGGPADNPSRQAFGVPWEAAPLRNKRDVWTVGTKPYPEAHYATFPPALIQPCILAGSRPGDFVLDPFAGSGTTAMVAEQHGRRWVASDLGYQQLQGGRLSGLQRELLMQNIPSD